MRWEKQDSLLQYSLFLFDLDGLLVNTEEMHFRAYKEMCHSRGYTLDLDFPQYFRMAQQDSKAPERYIYAQFPQLQKEEPTWSVLYAEKKRAFLHILANEPAPLLPGAQELLEWLEKANKKRCVVTHSGKDIVNVLRQQSPVLHSIPHWVTREDYHNPKPAPDGYIKAISALSEPGDTMIGFEDSDRGLRALMATPAVPILVNSIDDETRDRFARQGVQTFRTLHEVL